MSDPFRLRVQKALAAVLAEITPAGGYINDLSPYFDDEGEMRQRVFRGREIFGDDDSLPMISILEPPTPIEQLPPPKDSTASSGDWDLLIQGFVDDDPENPTDPGHILMADVKRRLSIEKRRKKLPHDSDILGMGSTSGKGNVVIGMTIGPGVVRPPGDVSSKAYFWLTLTLQIAEDMENPFV